MAEIQSLARGLSILNRMAESAEGVSVTDLASEMGLDKGSASRLLTTLVNYGFAEKDPVTRRFSLGPQVVVLSKILLSRLPLREVAKPYLRQLMSQTGECAHIGILARGQVLYIDQVESAASLRVNAEIGQMAPLHCTALGKVLLAFNRLPIPDVLAQRTEKTITSHAELRRDLEVIRREGYALDDEEYDLGVRCVAAPVYGFREKVIGSIGISGPTTRVNTQTLAELTAVVVQISNALSEKMRFESRLT